MYLVNESSKPESVGRAYETGETSHSLLDHPRIPKGRQVTNKERHTDRPKQRQKVQRIFTFYQQNITLYL